VLDFHGKNNNGIVIEASNLGIKHFDIVSRLREYFNFDNIILRNDARCAAIGEKKYGSLKEYEDCIFICLGTGIRRSSFYGRTNFKSKEI